MLDRGYDQSRFFEDSPLANSWSLTTSQITSSPYVTYILQRNRGVVATLCRGIRNRLFKICQDRPSVGLSGLLNSLKNQHSANLLRFYQVLSISRHYKNIQNNRIRIKVHTFLYAKFRAPTSPALGIS